MLNQNVQEIEIIIVDDGSTDDTENIVRDLKERDDRIQYIQQKNQGPGAARNRGIAKAAGKYIAFLDADDFWISKKLQKQLSKLNEDENLFLFGAMEYQYDNNTSATSRKYVQYPVCENREDLIFSFLSKKSVIGITPSVVVKKSILDKVGVFDEKLLTSEDTDLWVRILSKYDYFAFEDPLFVRRKHTTSQTTVLGLENKFKNGLEIIKKYRQDSGNPVMPIGKIFGMRYFHFSINCYQDQLYLRSFVYSMRSVIYYPRFLTLTSFYKQIVKIVISSISKKSF